MTNKLKTMATAIMATASIAAAAQQLKQFTLEDLNYGGNNYRNMQPRNMFFSWWGDRLMTQDLDYSVAINMKNGSRDTLFNIKDVNALLDGEKIHSAFYAFCPYADKTEVMLSNSNIRLLYD